MAELKHNSNYGDHSKGQGNRADRRNHTRGRGKGSK